MTNNKSFLDRILAEHEESIAAQKRAQAEQQAQLNAINAERRPAWRDAHRRAFAALTEDRIGEQLELPEVDPFGLYPVLEDCGLMITYKQNEDVYDSDLGGRVLLPVDQIDHRTGAWELYYALRRQDGEWVTREAVKSRGQMIDYFVTRAKEAVKEAEEDVQHYNETGRHKPDPADLVTEFNVRRAAADAMQQAADKAHRKALEEDAGLRDNFVYFVCQVLGLDRETVADGLVKPEAVNRTIDRWGDESNSECFGTVDGVTFMVRKVEFEPYRVHIVKDGAVSKPVKNLVDVHEVLTNWDPAEETARQADEEAAVLNKRFDVLTLDDLNACKRPFRIIGPVTFNADDEEIYTPVEYLDQTDEVQAIELACDFFDHEGEPPRTAVEAMQQVIASYDNLLSDYDMLTAEVARLKGELSAGGNGASH